MIKALLVLSTFLILQTAIGQGKLVGGLRTGYWLEKFQDANKNYLLKGNYKIIPIAKYDVIRELGNTCRVVKYKGSTPLIFFHELKGGKISVKDSIWNNYDEDGNLREINFWFEGLNQWTKYFDKQGYLTRYDYCDYENDTSFQFTYINGRLFKKAFYPPENKNQQTEIYYPDDPLTISKAELNFTIDFLIKPTSTETITITSKNDVLITAISSLRSFVSITDSNNNPLCFPLAIKANTSVAINILIAPVSANYLPDDTLNITTSLGDTDYKLYSKIQAHHINGRTVETLKSIQLSKTKDKFLILPRMGTVTGATIAFNGKYLFGCEIKEITKIDLSQFPSGIYDLEISSCHTGGQLKLVITE